MQPAHVEERQRSNAAHSPECRWLRRRRRSGRKRPRWNDAGGADGQPENDERKDASVEEFE